jgi:Short repeat of unknown function (DUF308)
LSGVGPQEDLDVALGAVMAVLPGVGLLSLVWLIGIHAILFGIALIVLALRHGGCRTARAAEWPDPREGGNE